MVCVTFPGHMTQEAVAAEIESQFLNVLAQFTCSAHIKHFICSLYTPMCEAVPVGQQHTQPQGGHFHDFMILNIGLCPHSFRLK